MPEKYIKVNQVVFPEKKKLNKVVIFLVFSWHSYFVVRNQRCSLKRHLLDDKQSSRTRVRLLPIILVPELYPLKTISGDLVKILNQPRQ